MSDRHGLASFDGICKGDKLCNVYGDGTPCTVERVIYDAAGQPVELELSRPVRAKIPDLWVLVGSEETEGGV